MTAQGQAPSKANLVIHEISGVAQKYRHMIKGKNTVMFIPKSKVPKDKKRAYGKIVCKTKAEKEENESTRLTVGRNLLDFIGNLSSPTASITTAKCVFNSVV